MKASGQAPPPPSRGSHRQLGSSAGDAVACELGNVRHKPRPHAGILLDQAAQETTLSITSRYPIAVPGWTSSIGREGRAYTMGLVNKIKDLVGQATEKAGPLLKQATEKAGPLLKQA